MAKKLQLEIERFSNAGLHQQYWNIIYTYTSLYLNLNFKIVGVVLC